MGSNPTLSATYFLLHSTCACSCISCTGHAGPRRSRRAPFKATPGRAEIVGVEKRRQQRSKQRLTCELVLDGKSHAGIVIDHSPAGVFVQTRARPGSESVVELVLRSDGASAEIRCEASVARERVTPTHLQTSAPGGVGLELIDPPTELFELLNAGAVPSEGDDRAGAGACVARTFRVRVKERSRPNSRVITVRCQSAQAARARALRQAGAGWQVSDIREL